VHEALTAKVVAEQGSSLAGADTVTDTNTLAELEEDPLMEHPITQRK
jgi:hypothetical protein